MKLVNVETGNEIKTGDVVATFRGEKVTLKGFTPPHKNSSSGRVSIEDEDGRCLEFFPGVINAEIIGGE